MKTLYCTLIITIFSLSSLWAQWVTNQNDIHNTNAGNVGIGTISPNAKLDVDGVVDIRNNGLVMNLGENNYTDTYIQIRKNSPYGVRFGLKASAFGATEGIGLIQTGGSRGFAIKVNEYSDWDSIGTPEFFIRPNGNVGVGTTSPDEKLHVNGTATITGDIGIIDDAPWKTGQHTLELQNSDAGDVVLSFHRAGYTSCSIRHPASGGLTLSGDGAFNSTHLFINPGGKIGIGTTSMPGSHKFYVDGSAVMEEVKVALSGSWPDYVFNKNYLLPTLNEVETYIKENGHLQDIPSETRVKENGINLGEMDAKLLQKIEELTLYTIQHDKTMRQQQKLIEKLAAQNEKLIKRIETLENR